MGVALEPDFALESPDIQKESEAYTPKRKLIEPVKPVIQEKRRSEARKLSQKHSPMKENPGNLTGDLGVCRPHPIGLAMMSLDRAAVKIIYGLMSLLEKALPFAK